MNKYTEKEIKRIETLLDEEMSEILKAEDKKEMLSRGDVVYNLYQIFQHYDELEPVLDKFFKDKHYKEKWGKEK